MKYLALLMFIGYSLSGAIELDQFKFEIKDDGFLLDSKIPGKFRVYNGKSRKYDELKVLESKDGRLVLGNDRYRWKMNFSGRWKMILAECEIENLSDDEIRLEPGIHLTVPLSGNDFFFNGLEVLECKGKPLSRMGLKGRSQKKIGSLATPFPIAALIGPEITCFAGNVFFDPVSYNGSRLEDIGGETARNVFIQRHAVGPKRTVKFRLVLGICETRYGREEGVIQAMYDSFPEQWEPVVTRENPYIWGTHSQYRAWYFKPDYEKERRYYSTIEWAYAPYKRSGDIYGHKELWDYKPLVRDFKVTFPAHINGTVFEYKTLGLEEFHRRRKEIFLKNARDFGYAFYASAAGTWCEIQLAREKYPDSITEDKDGVPMIHENGWVTGHDREIRVFPMGTSFARALREDMKRVYQELRMPGFALDCTGSGASYRGPAAEDYDMPGRAWDDKGVFIDQSVAVADFIHFIHHELDPNAEPKNKPFVWGNGGAVKVDYAMVEATFFSPIFHSWMPLQRYNIGPLPCVMHGRGYLIDDTIPNWRNMTQEEFLQEFSKLATYSIFNQFRYGMSSNHVTNNGNPTELYCTPELLELLRYGWQAQIPADCRNGGKMLYKARFGRGADTVFFFGNPYEEPMPAEFTIGNDLLGREQYIFIRKMRDHAATENRISANRTGFKENLAPRIPYLYEAVCGLTRIPDDGIRAIASSIKDIDRIRFEVRFAGNRAFTTDIVPRSIRTFTLESVKLNGKNIELNNVEIPANAELVFNYTSTQFNVPAGTILNFPFTDRENRPAFSVQIPSRPNADEQKQAERMEGYFRYCRELNITQPGKIRLIKSDDAPAAPTVRILVNRNSDEPHGISARGNEILVKAKDGQEADTLVKALSYVMDRRYERLIPFTPVDSIRKEMLDQLDLNGKHLPLIRCFESDEAAQ